LLLSHIFYNKNELKNIYLEYSSGEYQNFKSEIKARFEKIDNGIKNNEEEIIITELKNKPTTIFVHDKDLNGSDPELKLWIEKYNRYYNTKNIIFDKSMFTKSNIKK
jgi:transposase